MELRERAQPLRIFSQVCSQVATVGCDQKRFVRECIRYNRIYLVGKILGLHAL